MNRQPITLIHISDLHFVNNQSVIKGLLENQSILSKRHLGWLNYKFRRQQHFNPDSKSRLIRHLLKTDWDYLIITGDISTLALPREFQTARDQLEPLIKKGEVLFTTGNHDRYVKTFPEPNLLATYFNDCWPFNQPEFAVVGPNIKEIGESAVIVELGTAIPRAFYSSRGRLEKGLSAMQNRLKKDYKNRLKIAIGHYPAFLPPNEHEAYLHSLSGREKLKRFLVESGFRFYLHGHIHKSWMFHPIEGNELTIVNSGGCCYSNDRKLAAFHKIILTDKEISIERVNY